MKSVPFLVVYLNIFSILTPSWGLSSCEDDPARGPATGLTTRQKRLLRETWNIIRADPLGSGSAVLLEYLTRYPHYQKVFRTFASVPHQDLAKNPAFKKLSIAVIDSLSSMIDSLDDPDILVNILLTLAEDHLKLGVTKQQYMDLEEIMVHVLGVALGEKWDSEVSSTWVQTLDTIHSIIFRVYD